MAQALADVTGIETIKTLVACLGVPDFTVGELAQQTGVSRRTVDTVVRRYQYAFDRLATGKQDRPGRPPVRWRLRSDHLDEVLAAVDSHQSALDAGWQSEVADAPGHDTAEASLIMAAAALARGSDDTEQAKQLVAVARNSLAAAGFNSDGSPWTGQPDQGLAGRARFIAAIADVADACLSGDQQRIDQSQARAVPHLEEAKLYMSAAEWVPLAQKVLRAPGTVLSAPVLIEKSSVSYFRKLFPTLRAPLRKKDTPAGFVFMTDSRGEQPVSSTPVMALFEFKNSAKAKKKWADLGTLPDCVVVSKKTEVLETAAEYGAHFILHRENQATKIEIANAVNWRAASGDELPGAVTAVASPQAPRTAGEPPTAGYTPDAETVLDDQTQISGEELARRRDNPAVADLVRRARNGDQQAWDALVTHARNGDEQAWDALVGRYAPLVWSLCHRHRLGPADADTVSHNVWQRLLDQFGHLRDSTAIADWLATTTARECARVRRAGNIPDQDGGTAEVELLAAERRDALREAFNHLPPQGQRLMALLIQDSSGVLRRDQRPAGHPGRQHRAPACPLPGEAAPPRSADHGQVGRADRRARHQSGRLG